MFVQSTLFLPIHQKHFLEQGVSFISENTQQGEMEQKIAKYGNMEIWKLHKEAAAHPTKL